MLKEAKKIKRCGIGSETKEEQYEGMNIREVSLVSYLEASCKANAFWQR